MVEVHLYGRLRRHAPEPRPDRDSVVRLAPDAGETVRAVLERPDIPPTDVATVFLNGAMLFTRNRMAPWLRYQEADPVAARGLAAPVRPGDRLGVFAADMALLVV